MVPEALFSNGAPSDGVRVAWRSIPYVPPPPLTKKLQLMNGSPVPIGVPSMTTWMPLPSEPGIGQPLENCSVIAPPTKREQPWKLKAPPSKQTSSSIFTMLSSDRLKGTVVLEPVSPKAGPKSMIVGTGVGVGVMVGVMVGVSVWVAVVVGVLVGVRVGLGVTLAV